MKAVARLPSRKLHQTHPVHENESVCSFFSLRPCQLWAFSSLPLEQTLLWSVHWEVAHCFYIYVSYIYEWGLACFKILTGHACFLWALFSRPFLIFFLDYYCLITDHLIVTLHRLTTLKLFLLIICWKFFFANVFLGYKSCWQIFFSMKTLKMLFMQSCQS